MNRKRKVSFYKLVLERRTIMHESHNVQNRALDNEEVETCFNTIYCEHMRQLQGGSRAIDLDIGNRYVIEVVEYNNHKVFAKIGQQNSANTVAIRDRATLESRRVPMTATQLLELYTYCLIDFESGIVSYIGINGAPRISAIKNLFDKFLNEQSIHANLASIMTRDILQAIMRKRIISALTVTAAVPTDQVLSDDIGLGPADFDSLRNVKTRVATYKMVATRNKNLFANSRNLANVVESIRYKFGDNLQKVSVNAKDENESSQTYDLLQYNFTKTVTLGGGEEHISFDENDFKIALDTTYTNNREELLRYAP